MKNRTSLAGLSIAVLVVASLTIAADSSEAPVILPPVKVPASDQDFYLHVPPDNHRLAFLKKYVPEKDGSLTRLRMSGAKDLDRIVSINGRAISDLERSEFVRLMFQTGMPITLEVRSADSKRSRFITAIRVSESPPQLVEKKE